MPLTGVFGRRLNPRTRRPLNRFRNKDTVTPSDVAEEVTPGTVATTQVQTQNKNRGRNTAGFRGRDLPDWLQTRRRNRARERLRGTQAVRKTEKEQVEDAPLDVLENNGFDGAESTVVEFSRPPENKVTEPLNPHEVLKQLSEDANDAAHEGIAELLDAASKAGSEDVNKASEHSETDTFGHFDIPREHTTDNKQERTFHDSPSEDGVTTDAEYTDDVYVVAEPEPEPEPKPEPEPEPQVDDTAAIQPELQHPPEYVFEDDLQDKPKTSLSPYRLSQLPSSRLTHFGPLKTAITPSPVSQNLPRSQSVFSASSTENFDDGRLRLQTKEDQTEVFSTRDNTDSSDSDHTDPTTVSVVNNSHSNERDGVVLESDNSYHQFTTEFPETGSVFPNNQLTTFSPGKSQDYYIYQYDDLYDDDHAEQSADQNFGASSAEVMFAVPVTEYEYYPEDALTTTPAAEVVVEMSEPSPDDPEVTTLKGSLLTTEAPQVATDTSENTSNLFFITDVPDLADEMTTEVSEVTDEVFEVTEDVPELTTEDTVLETTTESVNIEEQQPHATTTLSSSTLRPATPLITFLPFPSTTTTTTTEASTTTATTSRRRLVTIRPLHARLLGSRKKKLSSLASSVKKDSNVLKIVGKSTVAEIQSSDPVVCFPGHPCVRAVGVGRLLQRP